jgi:hypothetical protein
VGPGSAPTTGTWLENDAMKLRRGTKGILQTLFSVDGLLVSMLKTMKLSLTFLLH